MSVIHYRNPDTGEAMHDWNAASVTYGHIYATCPECVERLKTYDAPPLWHLHQMDHRAIHYAPLRSDHYGSSEIWSPREKDVSCGRCIGLMAEHAGVPA